MLEYVDPVLQTLWNQYANEANQLIQLGKHGCELEV